MSGSAASSHGRLPLACSATVLACSSGVLARRRPLAGGRPTALLRRAGQAVQENYYEVLGVSTTANEREIKAAFRRQAKKWHPDVNKSEGAKDRFDAIAKAYKVLSNLPQRERYDSFGEAGVKDPGIQDSGSNSDIADMDLEDILGDVFTQFFRGEDVSQTTSRQRRGTKLGPRKGSDIQCQVSFPFNIACFGGDRNVKVKRRERCEDCDGWGLKDRDAPGVCRTCGGVGEVMQETTTPLGVMNTLQKCSACGGGGVDPGALCTRCKGAGTVQKVVNVPVKVPAGCSGGDQLRLRSQGDTGARRGPSGDLYIRVKVKESENFHREGFDIYTDEVLSIYDAIFGTSRVVKTIDGHAKLAIPQGTQPETVMRMKEKGVPKLGRNPDEPLGRGDHFVTIKVEIPRTMTPEQIELLEAARSLEGRS